MAACVFNKKYTSNRKFSNHALSCENLVFPANGDKNHPAGRWVRFTSIPAWRRANPESGPVRNKKWGCLQRLRRRDGEPRNELYAQVFETGFSARIREQPCVLRFHRPSHFDSPSIDGSGEKIHEFSVRPEIPAGHGYPRVSRATPASRPMSLETHSARACRTDRKRSSTSARERPIG